MSKFIPILLVAFVTAAAYIWIKLRTRRHSASASDRRALESGDTGDPIEDTNRRMAYGWYEDAADLIRKAIETEPNRPELKAKLFEVLFVWGEVGQFREAGINYKASLRGKPEWRTVCTMATQLCPNDRTFR